MYLRIKYRRVIGMAAACQTLLSSYAIAQTVPEPPLLDCDPAVQECTTSSYDPDIKFLPDYQTECDKRIRQSGQTCQAENILCVGSSEDFSTIQDAIDSSEPGDAICIRGGNYQLSTKPGLRIDVNGTSQNRIYVEPYPAETVAIHGGGSAAAWDGLTEQKPTAGFEQNGIEISGDFITVRGLEVSYFGDTGVEIAGDNVTIEGLHVHNNWFDGITVSGMGSVDQQNIQNTLIRYNWLHNIRHGPALRIYAPNDRLTNIDNTRMEFNLSYWNGYEPDGDKVPAIPGDPAGGGNSDSIASFKACSYGDNSAVSGVGNMCTRSAFRFNIGWESADDCFDLVLDEYSYWGNIGWNCGPEGGRGMKQLREGVGPATIVGNFLHGGGTNRQIVGFELRQAAGQFRFVNNAATYHINQGLFLQISGVSNQGSIIGNNLSWQNGSTILGNAGIPESNNWTEDDPRLTSCAPVLDIQSGLLDAQEDGKKRWEYIYSQVSEACGPSPGSPLIDGGQFVEGIHCTTADDDPNDPYDPTDGNCWHWKGDAPDIGPFER